MVSMLVIEKNCINKCFIIDGRCKVVNVKKVLYFFCLIYFIMYERGVYEKL